ncbi:hypothetical protein BG004_005099 [Podila humilis]|nr:hypothetical protein BG004_005099 [Podila humilis]
MVRRESEAPLLANEDPRDSFDDDERALLASDLKTIQRKGKRHLCLGLGIAVVLASTVAIATTYYFTNKPAEQPKPIPPPASAPKNTRNVIMMVSDGFGPASQTYGRSYWQYQNNFTESAKTSLDHILVGASRTRSSDSLVTDSAAGATAFSCAMKTYNAAIGVDPSGTPCGTVLEAAKEEGLLTGLVVTSRVTHATPASFSAHVVHRDMEADIAVQQMGDYELGRQVDLMLGGGLCFFLPNTTEGSCRIDNRDLVKESAHYGWNDVLLHRRDFDSRLAGGKVLALPTMGLFHASHMNFEIDRQASEEPALHEMAQAALDSLKAHSAAAQKGFFLMIEGSRIDMGAHNNDPVAHVHEILEYHRTIALVREFVAQNPDTVMISTSDHETGGFTLGMQPDPHTYPDYLWRPEVIERASASTEILTRDILLFQGKHRHAFIRDQILDKGLGIRDATEEEIEFLANPEALPGDILVFLGHAISRRAYLGWTTLGHTGVDVNLYVDAAEESVAGQEGVKFLRGNHENTEIGEFMASYLNLNLAPVTKRLIQSSDNWFKRQRDFMGMGRVRSHHEETGH